MQKAPPYFRPDLPDPNKISDRPDKLNIRMQIDWTSMLDIITPFFETISLFSWIFFGKFSPYACLVVRAVGKLEVLGITETGLKAMEQ